MRENAEERTAAENSAVHKTSNARLINRWAVMDDIIENARLNNEKSAVVRVRFRAANRSGELTRSERIIPTKEAIR